MRYVIVSVVKGKAGNFNNNLRKEVLKKYNSFYKDDAFREMPKKRQIIALLNAYGLCSMSMMLLKITEIIKNNIRK